MPDRLGFVAHTRRLLDLERAAEAEESRALRERKTREAIAESGQALLKLAVLEEETGPGGRPAITLCAYGEEPLPPHRFKPGDLVELTARDGKRAATGVLTKTRLDRLLLLLDDELEEDLPPRVDLWRLSSDVTWRRMDSALQTVLNPERAPGRRIIDFAFDERGVLPVGETRFEALDDRLDASQLQAIRRALTAEKVFLIHGPPGTGKTTALVEYVRQEIRRGARVLATASTNVAVDHLGERLAHAGESVLRLGHPARIAPRLSAHSLDARLEAREHSGVLHALRRDIDKGRTKLRRAKDFDSRRTALTDLRSLERELRDLERQVILDLIRDASVVLATATGAGDHLLSAERFDLVVLDEAAQTLEAAAWIPLAKAAKVVMVGDHHQLPPTILSAEAARQGLAETLFDRLARQHKDTIVSMLTRQYRMHETIMEFSSAEFYGGALVADPSVAAHRLTDLEGVTLTEATEPVLLVIDTAGRDFSEESGDEETSRWNEGEAALLIHHVQALIAAGVRPEDIAAISPYHAQVRRLRERLQPEFPDLEIDTVDGFQGREKEAIAISLVRSNADGEVGFLADPRRMNVALTRGRRQVTVIGDSATVSHHPFLERLFAHLSAKGTWRSAWEYDVM